MSSRDRILQAVKQNQPGFKLLQPDKYTYVSWMQDLPAAFTEILTSIGGTVYSVKSNDEINSIILKTFSKSQKIFSTQADIINTIDGISSYAPHDFSNLDLCILKSNLAVAENGAVWISGDDLAARVLPFITQHLAVIIQRSSIVETMHKAYQLIGSADYGYGVFIAGPSKTADIEQSLVLGAHGAVTMTVFVLE